MNAVKVYLSTYFIIVALLYFSITYLDFNINYELVVILAAVLFILTCFHLYKSRYQFNPINVGILLFTPLMILSLLVQ